VGGFLKFPDEVSQFDAQVIAFNALQAFIRVFLTDKNLCLLAVLGEFHQVAGAFPVLSDVELDPEFADIGMMFP